MDGRTDGHTTIKKLLRYQKLFLHALQQYEGQTDRSHPERTAFLLWFFLSTKSKTNIFSNFSKAINPPLYI